VAFVGVSWHLNLPALHRHTSELGMDYITLLYKLDSPQGPSYPLNLKPAASGGLNTTWGSLRFVRCLSHDVPSEGSQPPAALEDA
jgi:hypothetical protein